MPRRPDDVLVSVSVDASELEVLAAMRRAGGIDSDANLIRVALWSLADHLGIDMPNRAFDLRQHVGGMPPPRPKGTRLRVPNPRISQHVPPGPSHPWRHLPKCRTQQ